MLGELADDRRARALPRKPITRSLRRPANFAGFTPSTRLSPNTAAQDTVSRHSPNPTITVMSAGRPHGRAGSVRTSWPSSTVVAGSWPSRWRNSRSPCRCWSRRKSNSGIWPRSSSVPRRWPSKLRIRRGPGHQGDCRSGWRSLRRCSAGTRSPRNGTSTAIMSAATTPGRR